MYLGTESEYSLIMIIEILEVLLFVEGIALAIQTKRKLVKVLNVIVAVFWMVCIVKNAINYGLFQF